MNYNELEAELCEALTAAEWIASVRWDRNDTSIEWTPLSKANLADFEASVHQVLDYRSANRRAFLHEFAIYHRLTEPTRLESIKKKLRPMIPEAEFLLVTCPADGSGKYCLYSPTVDDKLSTRSLMLPMPPAAKCSSSKSPTLLIRTFHG